jgi:hypothetical protein
MPTVTVTSSAFGPRAGAKVYMQGFCALFARFGELSFSSRQETYMDAALASGRTPVG